MKYLLTTLLLLPMIANSQKRISGVIVDKTSGKRVPFVTVELVVSGGGATADEQGGFSIYCRFPHDDSLRVSSVGYNTSVLPLRDWTNGRTIELEQRQRILKTVVITNNPKPIITLNSFRKCDGIGTWQSLNSLFQQAQRFEAPEDDMQLTNIELCKDPSTSIFRIRIYALDTLCECPGADLADSVIEVRSKARHVQVNLEKYGIIIPDKSFFVAVEWLYISENVRRMTTRQRGKKVTGTYYGPFIQFVEVEDSLAEEIWENWGNGKWQRLTGDSRNIKITTRLK